MAQRTAKLIETELPAMVNLERTIPNEAITVAVRASDLIRIVMNLMLNTKDAQPEGGNIQLGTKRITNYALPVVTDSGYGMDAITKKQVFTPFFTNKQSEGNGLGLTVAQEIATQSKGTITIQSEPNHGTTFHIKLPI